MCVNSFAVAATVLLAGAVIAGAAQAQGPKPAPQVPAASAPAPTSPRWDPSQASALADAVRPLDGPDRGRVDGAAPLRPPAAADEPVEWNVTFKDRPPPDERYRRKPASVVGMQGKVRF